MKEMGHVKQPVGPREGWGLTSIVRDDREYYTMYMSDGSSKLFELDGSNFNVLRTIEVTDERGQPLEMINELEYAKGFIYANVWHTDDIVKIDPNTGEVVMRYSVPELVYAEENYQIATRRYSDHNVLNGIAYDPTEDVFYLSGKRWHLVFKVKLY